MKTRVCNRCNKNKPLKKFKQKNKNKYFWNCEECRKKFGSHRVLWKPLKLKCLVCEEEFIQKTSHQKYCSKLCGQISNSFEYRIENINELKNSFLKLRFEIFKRDNFTCQYCGRNVKEDKIKIHCDHIIPKNKGGKDILENLTTSCEECNLGKSDIILNNLKITT